MTTSVRMRSWQILPAVPLGPAGPVTSEFLMRGVADVRQAGRYLEGVPYGRNSDRGDWGLVFPEKRGTCSTKHALLAELALEHGLPLKLMLGIYEMNERNTPGVGRVLERYGLPGILEAHCYLVWENERIDVSRRFAPGAEPIEEILREETITSDQIRHYKVDLHREWLGDWVAGRAAAGGRSLEEVWDIREQCIAALSTV